MRTLAFLAVLGAALSTAAPSQAATMRFDPALAPPAAPIVKVQLTCDPSRCIDPRTGAYTASGCNDRGCYPISGVVGYTDPRSIGYGYRGGRQHYREW